MRMFWEFFTFELRFRAKSPSTYIYFLLWLAFSFLCIASENFGPVANSNGKVLLNGPYGITFNDQAACLFGLIIIAAISAPRSCAIFNATHIKFSLPSQFETAPTWAGAGPDHSLQPWRSSVGC